MAKARNSWRGWILAIIVVALVVGLTGCSEVLGLLGGDTTNNNNNGGSAKLEVNPQIANLTMGQDQTLTVICEDSSGKTQSVQLLVQDTTKATASTFGTLIMLHPLSVGSTNLLIAGVGKTLIVPINVASSSGGTGDLTVSTTNVSLLPGGNQMVTVTSASPFTANTTSPLISVMQGSGYIMINALQNTGTATINLQSAGGSATITVIISSTLTPASLTLDMTSVSLNTGESRTVTVTAVAQGGAQDSYSVSKSDFAQSMIMGSSLSLYGMKAGTTQLLITTNSGKSATLSVTVTAVANQIPPPAMKPPYVETTTGMVSLFWDMLSNAQGYDIERARKSDMVYTALGSVASAMFSYSDTPPTRDLTYVYRVRGKSGANLGIWATQEVYVPSMGSSSPYLTPYFSFLPWATANSVNLDWEPVPLATYYEIERTNPDGTQVIPLINAPSDSYIDYSNLFPENFYGYRVRGANASGAGPWSEILRVQTETTNTSILPSPLGLNANSDWMTGSLVVNLSWQYVSGATGWVIQRQDNYVWVEKARLSGAAMMFWQDTTAQASSTYYYRVAAIDQAAITGNFGQFQPVNTGINPATSAPPKPYPFSWYAPDSNSAYVSWDAENSQSFDVLLAETYASCVAATSATALQSRASIPEYSATFTGLVGGRSYFIKIRGYNLAGGFGPWTDPLQVDTPLTMQLPGTPMNLIDTGYGYSAELNANYVELTWSVASYASTYRVERAMVTAGMTMAWTTLTPAAGLQGTSFKDFGIYSNMNYKYRVTGENTLGSGTASAEFSYTAPQTANVTVKLY